MMDDLTVYIDASIAHILVGGATAPLPADEWRDHTTRWWETQRPRFELYTSELAIEGVGKPDPSIAAQQLEVLDGIPRLEVTGAVPVLADLLMDKEALRPGSRDYALHIAVAAVHNIAYLLTWDFRRLVHGGNRPLISEVCEQQGYRSPEVCWPSELLQLPMARDEILEELWEARDTMAREWLADPEKYRAKERARKYPGFTYASPGQTRRREAEDREGESDNQN